MAAVDYFLKIDGIEGESVDSRHAGEIDVVAFSWGVEHQGGSRSGGGGAGTGRAQPDEFVVVKQIDRSSPRLAVATASGQSFRTAVLAARRAGTSHDFLVYSMEDVSLAGYHTEGDDTDDVPLLDEVSLRFSSIEISYRPQQPDGSLGTAVTHGYDFQRGRAF